MRDHVASGLTDGELEHARRELAASLALSRPGSPIRTPIQARMSAMGLCSCDFATDDYDWLVYHLELEPEPQR
jgi:hypothetical protein